MAIETKLTLELSEDEAVLLREALAEYLADLSTEIAGTDALEFRDRLKSRQDTLRGLMNRLGQR